MPVFDPLSPNSPAAAALHKTADLIASLAVFQVLSESADAAEALTKIPVGIQADPDDGDQFKLPELKNTFFQLNLYPPVPSLAATDQGQGTPTPMTGGAFGVYIRRHVRESEVTDHTDRNGLFLWFYDCVQALIYDILAAAELVECPRLNGITHECDAAFSPKDHESAQGEYLWASFHVRWGDEVEQ